MLVPIAVVFLAVLWRFGRTVFTGVTKWLLWALGAVCASTGLVFLVTSEGKILPVVGGLILWEFAAYTIKVAASSPKCG
jgi:hypothetical protein